MLTYLVEIITKKDWETNKDYGKKIYDNLDKSFYRKSLRFLKSKIFTSKNLSDKRIIFLSTSGSTLTNSSIIKYNLDDNDKFLVNLINQNTKYKIPLNKIASFLTIGKVLSNKNTVSIQLAFTEIMLKFNQDSDTYEKHKTSRELTLKNKELQLETEEDPQKKANLVKIIAGIKKTLAVEAEKANTTNSEKLSQIIEQYNKKVEYLLRNKYVITLTYDTRAVASQSTGVSWRSCMNLDDGEYNSFVSKSINIGTFIAYLATKKDKTELNDPLGRVLCKAYYGYDEDGKNPDIIWIAGAFYPGKDRNKNKWFCNEVQAFLNNHNKPKYRYYTQTTHNYNDSGEQQHIDVTEYFGISADKVIDNRLSKYNNAVKGIKKIKPASYDDLTDSEQEEVRELAEEMAIDNYDYTSLDNFHTRQEFVSDNYSDELTEKQYELARSEIHRKDFETDDEYEDAVSDQVGNTTNRELHDMIQDICNDNDGKYHNYLQEIFNNNVYDYIDLDRYLPRAFRSWVADNY